MASDTRSTIPDLIEKRFEDDRHMSFYQLVALALGSDPDAAQPGDRGPFSKEVVMFRSHPGLSFAHRDVQSIRAGKTDTQMPSLVFDVNFMGLYGAASPLPVYFTEEIIFDDPDDSPVRHFLDIFNHRLLSYLYRSWSKYRAPMHYQPHAQDHFSDQLFAFAGLKDKQSRLRSRLDWERLIPCIGLLSAKTGSVETITRVVSVYTGLQSLSVEQNVRCLLDIDSSQKIILGKLNSTLGENSSLGDRVPDVGSRFRLNISKLSLEQYRQLLPGESMHLDIIELVGFCCREPQDFELLLELEHQNAPPFNLSENAQERLGFTSWLGAPNAEQTSISYQH